MFTLNFAYSRERYKTCFLSKISQFYTWYISQGCTHLNRLAPVLKNFLSMCHFNLPVANLILMALFKKYLTRRG